MLVPIADEIGAGDLRGCHRHREYVSRCDWIEVILSTDCRKQNECIVFHDCCRYQRVGGGYVSSLICERSRGVGIHGWDKQQVITVS